MSTIAVLGTLDTKGAEHAFVADRIKARGHEVVLIDVGTGSDPQVTPDVTRFEVAAAGGIDLQPLIDKQDRGECVVAISQAAPILLASLVAEEEIRLLAEAATKMPPDLRRRAMRPMADVPRSNGRNSARIRPFSTKNWPGCAEFRDAARGHAPDPPFSIFCFVKELLIVLKQVFVFVCFLRNLKLSLSFVKPIRYIIRFGRKAEMQENSKFKLFVRPLGTDSLQAANGV